MSANNLLLLLSAKTQGTWMQFRAAVEELHLPTDNDTLDDTETDDLPRYHRLRLNLQRLAHVEFRAKGCEDGWRVTPPTLAITPHEQQTKAVLCGARSQHLMDRIRNAGIHATLETSPQDDAPDRVVITAPQTEMLDLAAQARITLQQDAPTTLLAALPPIDHGTTHHGALPVGPGWQVDRFSTSHARWTTASREEACVHTGLFRFQLGFQRFYYYCNAGIANEIPVQVGKYLALRRYRRKVVSYDPSQRAFNVPPIFRPPLLIERSLILCSGNLPTYNATNAHLVYADIPPRVARLAFQLLRQEAA